MEEKNYRSSPNRVPPFAFSEDYHRCMVRRLFITRVRSIVQVLLELAVCCVDVESRAKNSITNIKHSCVKVASLLLPTPPNRMNEANKTDRKK